MVVLLQRKGRMRHTGNSTCFRRTHLGKRPRSRAPQNAKTIATTACLSLSMTSQGQAVTRYSARFQGTLLVNYGG